MTQIIKKSNGAEMALQRNEAKADLLQELDQKALSNVSELLESQSARMALFRISSSLKIEDALFAKQIHKTEQGIGREKLTKLIAFVIHSFVHSLQIQKMDFIDTLECADIIISDYKYESIDDLILAFKSAKKGSVQLYNRIGAPEVFSILSTYLEKKAEVREKQKIEEKKKKEKMLNTADLSGGVVLKSLIAKFDKDKVKEKEEKEKRSQERHKEMKAFYAIKEKERYEAGHNDNFHYFKPEAAQDFSRV